MQRIDSLQAGRALAALAVVGHHANLAAHDFGHWSIPALNLGYLGVDFFFVLSGFIIAWSVPGKSPGEFAWHRFRRVVLPYWPIGIALALLYVLLPSASDGNRQWSWLTTVTLLPINAQPALSVAWTLQHEMLFYAIVLASYFRGHLTLALMAWAAAIAAATAMGVDWLALQPINLEFIAGVIACHCVRKGLGDWRWTAVAIVPAGLWILLGAERDLSPLVGLAFALCIPPLVKSEIRIHPALMFLGAASYSLYLAHGIAISVAARLWPSLPFLICAGVGGGIAYYFVLERPVLRLRKRHSRGQPQRSIPETTPTLGLAGSDRRTD